MDSLNQKTLLSSSSRNNDEVLNIFLESNAFLNNPIISDLIEKVIKMGFSLEAIKETFMRMLYGSGVDFSNVTTAAVVLDYNVFKDQEKFIEFLMLNADQIKTQNKLQQQRYDEDDNEIFNADTDMFSDFDTDAPQSSIFSQKQGITKPITKPITGNSNKLPSQIISIQLKHQQEQDFITQSINRINDKSNLRPIIIDCNDLALSSHNNRTTFLMSRVKQAVDYFQKRNHQIFAILTSWRKEQIMGINLDSNNVTSSSQSALANPPSTAIASNPTPDQQILLELEERNIISYTPSKRVGAKRIVCDDDSYILKVATQKEGIIVSNDNFKRFLNHNDTFKMVIEERVLMYSFIDNIFMPAEDPLGKNGPSLDNFLRFESCINQQYMRRCPYKKKCTYGSKCKFWHPERGLNQGNQLYKSAHQSVLDDAKEQRMRLEIIKSRTEMVGAVFTTPLLIQQQHQQDLFNIDEVQAEKKKAITDNFEQRIQKLENFSGIKEVFNSMGMPNFEKTTTNAAITTGIKKPQNPTVKNPFWNPNNNLSTSGMKIKIGAGNNFDKPKSQKLTKPDEFNFSNPTGMKKQQQQQPYQTCSLEKSELKEKLLAQHIAPDMVEEVLNKYKEETDIEKLIFLARGISFSSDF